VGPPYFNLLFIPVTAPLAALAGIGALARWKQDRISKIMIPLYPLLAASLILGISGALMFDHFSAAAALGIFLAVWVTLTTLYGIYKRVANRNAKLRSLSQIPAGFYGMSIAHIGIAVFVVGISLTSIYSIEKDVRLVPNETFVMGEYSFKFNGVRDIQGPNYIAKEGDIVVSKKGTQVASLQPQKRIYNVQQSPMTEAAIDPGLSRDIYVALGEPLGDDGSWSVRLYHKPYIRWIWLGAIFMALGGFVAILDKRYRLARRRKTVLSSESLGARVSS
jgi:cytochrome c-type biogenesis protein CcmF